jgi:dehydrogenase/reductase SDR family protein 1
LNKLKDKIALVTGASRGLGKGIAIALAKEGATLYITGRTMRDSSLTSPLGGSIDQTADEISKYGGKCHAIQCDHTIDREVDAVFGQIKSDHGKLDLLVNAAWGGYEYFHDGTEFWTEGGFWDAPISRWDHMFNAGVRASYYSSCLAARMMIEQRSGCIVNLSFWASQRVDQGVAYSTSKAATDQMTAAMAHELKPHHIPAICLYPGIVRTEAVLKSAAHFDLSNSESPEFTGRVIAAMAADPEIMQKTGKVLVVAKEASRYGIKDIDGRQPSPLTLNDFN